MTSFQPNILPKMLCIVWWKVSLKLQFVKNNTLSEITLCQKCHEHSSFIVSLISDSVRNLNWWVPNCNFKVFTPIYCLFWVEILVLSFQNWWVLEPTVQNLMGSKKPIGPMKMEPLIIYDSPVSALSSARSRSDSTICSFLAMSSYFLSASSARILASLSWFSRDSMRASSDKALFSSTLHIRWESSPAVAAKSSFWVAVSNLSSDFSRSYREKE